MVKTQLETTPDQAVKKKSSLTHRNWGGRTFRFTLSSFRLGGNVSQRRFSIVEAALLLILAYLASRGLGVVRQSIFNTLFGTGPEANAYYAAYRLPDTLFNLIAGGALSHALIPVFLSYEKDHDQREAWRLISLVFNVMLVALTILLLIGEYLTPAFVENILVPGPGFTPAEKALTTTLTRIMLLQPLVLGLGTIVTSVLNGKRQFLLPALSIAVYNIGLIGGLLFSLAIPSVGIYGPTWGVLAAATLQVLVMMPALIKQGARYTFIWDLKHPGLREVMRLLIPNALGVGVSSIGTIIDTNFSTYLPDPASLAALHNAQLLFNLPLALVAQAIGQALLPQMAVQAAFSRYVRLRQTILKVVGGSILLSVPAAIVLYVLGKPTIRILFQHGAFTAHSSALTNTALLGYAIGLPGLIAGYMISSVFISLKDARTPFLVSVFILIGRYALILFLLSIYTNSSALLAIPLSTSIAGYVESGILCLILFWRLRLGVKRDKGMQRLQKRREYLLNRKKTQKLPEDVEMAGGDGPL